MVHFKYFSYLKNAERIAFYFLRNTKEQPPYGAHDDHVIIEAIHADERILIRPEEFEFLMDRLYDNWMSNKSEYIQMLEEWSECSGCFDISAKPSLLLDIGPTIVAIQQVKGVDRMEFTKMTQEDISLLLSFIIRNKDGALVIWKE